MNAFDVRSEDNQAMFYDQIAVIGAGAWGTALAATAARAGRAVRLWGRDEEVVAAINSAHRNPRYLPDTDLPEGIRATTDLREALAGADAVLLVTPSTTTREMSRALAPLLPAGAPVIICSKGIECGSGLLMSEVAAEELPGHPIGALSGPTFADETAAGHPTAATIASDFPADAPPASAPAARMAISLGTESFRPYVSDDLVGVEVGGAVKNVLAIACGIAMGAGFGSNTRAAIITRGLDEMKSLAEALGGRRETVTGLSGIGDLTLTCTSLQSRNLSLGQQLGKGLDRADCFDGKPVVVEGERNALSVTDLAREKGIRMPICEAVRAILHDGAEIGETYAKLWSRPIVGEPKSLDLRMEHPADEAALRRFAEQMP